MVHRKLLGAVLMKCMYSSWAKWKVLLQDRWSSEVLRKWFNETGAIKLLERMVADVFQNLGALEIEKP